MKLYLAKCATADNYILAETEDGVLASNCAPDGCWAGIRLYGYDENGEEIDYAALAAKLHDATDPDLCASDLAWMGEPCCPTMADFESKNGEQEPFNQDAFYLIGEYAD